MSGISTTQISLFPEYTGNSNNKKPFQKGIKSIVADIGLQSPTVGVLGNDFTDYEKFIESISAIPYRQIGKNSAHLWLETLLALGETSHTAKFCVSLLRDHTIRGGMKFIRRSDTYIYGDEYQFDDVIQKSAQEKLLQYGLSVSDIRTCGEVFIERSNLCGSFPLLVTSVVSNSVTKLVLQAVHPTNFILLKEKAEYLNELGYNNYQTSGTKYLVSKLLPYYRMSELAYKVKHAPFKDSILLVTDTYGDTSYGNDDTSVDITLMHQRRFAPTGSYYGTHRSSINGIMAQHAEYKAVDSLAKKINNDFVAKYLFFLPKMINSNCEGAGCEEESAAKDFSEAFENSASVRKEGASGHVVFDTDKPEMMELKVMQDTDFSKYSAAELRKIIAFDFGIDISLFDEGSRSRGLSGGQAKFYDMMIFDSYVIANEATAVHEMYSNLFAELYKHTGDEWFLEYMPIHVSRTDMVINKMNRILGKETVNLIQQPNV